VSGINRHFILTFLAAAAMFSAACKDSGARSSTAQPAQPMRFEVKGILVSIGFAERKITVQHEDIPDYMPAMTMPFPVRDMREVEALSVGNAVRFDLYVTVAESWIANVQKIDPGEVKLPSGPQAGTSSSTGDRLKEGDPLPSFELVDDQGRSLDKTMYEGKPFVLTFIFTRCPLPDFCPLMSNNFARLVEATAADAKLADTQLLSISFDPEHDKPQQLAEYAQRFRGNDKERWRFATGSMQQVKEICSRFAVQVRPVGESIDHSLATAIIGRDGVIKKIWRGNGWKVDEVLSELRSL
jgi:protein SCO1/2